MKSSRDIEAELAALKASLRVPQRRHASLVEAGAAWLSDEVHHAVPAELQERLAKWRDRAEQLLSKHPVASAAVALCIGVALSQLWRRHHDR